MGVRKLFDLTGRVALITGGSRGLGLQIAEALGEMCAKVVITARKQPELDEASVHLRGLGSDVTAIANDLQDTHSAKPLVEQVLAKHARLDILVNNAGIALRRPSVELTRQDWQAVVDVNLTGVFLCARAAARHMLAARRGAIVNVSSIMGLSGGGLYPNISYQSTKGALVNLTRALAVEWAPSGVRVNAVAPTWVRTDLTRGLMDDPALVARMLDMTPLHRLAEPEDVAAAIVFLASDGAAMITGHTLPVDGGYLAQ